MSCYVLPPMTQDEQHRLNLYVSGGLVAAIDEWRRQERDIPTRSEAARRLIATALKASGRIGADPDRPPASAKAPRKRGG